MDFVYEERNEMRDLKKKIARIMLGLIVLCMASMAVLGNRTAASSGATVSSTSSGNVAVKDAIAIVTEKIAPVKIDLVSLSPVVTTPNKIDNNLDSLIEAPFATEEYRELIKNVKHKWKCNIPLIFKSSCKEIRSYKKRVKKQRKLGKMRKKLEMQEMEL